MKIQERRITMKSLHTIQKLSKLGEILSKTAFIFAVIGCCGCIAGMLSMGFGNGELLRIGAITLHGLIYEKYGYNGRSIAAASFNRFTAAFVYYVLGSSLSSAFDTDIDASSFFRLLCAAHGTGWSVSWS